MNHVINLFTTKIGMKNNNNIIEKNLGSINNDNDKEIKKKESDFEKINSFLKIDQKNNFSELNKNEISNIKLFIDNFKDNEDLIKDNINVIMNKLFEKISNSNLSNDIFIISQNISKLISKNNKIGKDNIDKIINYLMKSNKSKNNITLLLNTKKCQIIGAVLAYSFSRLQQYKIKDMNKLIELRKTIIEKGIDVQRDFAKYCKENKVTDKKITYYWKSQRNKYICLPELIFLINIYSQVTEIEIDSNLFDESLNEDESQAQLIELTILNIYWLLNSLKSFKINLINEKLIESLYDLYFQKLNNFSLYFQETNKKNKNTKEDYNLKKKWNFVDFFKLEEKRNISNQKNYDYNFQPRKSLAFEDIIKSRALTSFDNKRNTIANLNDNLHNSSDFDIKNINKIIDNKNKDNLIYVIKPFHYTFEIILITFFTLSFPDNTIDLEIVMNDSYKWEFLAYFKSFLGFEKLDEKIREFNILDILIYNKIKNINKLNIEINALDYVTFENVLNIINDNKSLTSINISFFSSDVVYSPQFIYKICKATTVEEMISNFIEDKSTYLFEDIRNIEEKILNKLSSYFTFNLSAFFEIIRNLNNLTELCLNIEIPYNLINYSNFINPILKFILNILFYAISNAKLKKLCLLSPQIILDNRKIPNINYLINSINEDDCLLLTDLSLQFKFYQISDINNFVNSRLQILNIGDLDIYTFKILCEKICSPVFNLNSSLKKLSIGLLKTIVNLNIEIKLLIRRLFSIKIKNFVSLGLYTNIVIEEELEFDYLLKILDNNWISEYTIVLNSIPIEIMTNYEKNIKNIKFFVPHNLEGKLLEPEDIMALNNNSFASEVDNNKDYYDEAFWYLKYLFENVYYDKNRNEMRIKNMIMGILKYLYFLKTPIINFLLVGNGY